MISGAPRWMAIEKTLSHQLPAVSVGVRASDMAADVAALLSPCGRGDWGQRLYVQGGVGSGEGESLTRSTTRGLSRGARRRKQALRPRSRECQSAAWLGDLAARFARRVDPLVDGPTILAIRRPMSCRGLPFRSLYSPRDRATWPRRLPFEPLENKLGRTHRATNGEFTQRISASAGCKVPPASSRRCIGISFVARMRYNKGGHCIQNLYAPPPWILRSFMAELMVAIASDANHPAAIVLPGLPPAI